jgi:hypothetical protein
MANIALSEEEVYDILSPFQSMGAKGFVILLNNEGVAFLIHEFDDTDELYETLVETAKTLSVYPYEITEIVEGVHLFESEPELPKLPPLDLMTKYVAIENFIGYQGIVYATEGEKHSVFCMGQLDKLVRGAIFAASNVEINSLSDMLLDGEKLMKEKK